MPVTGQDTIANAPPRQRIAHVRTLVIGRVEVALVVKERDAASLCSNRFRRAFRDILQVSHSDKVRF